MDFTRFVKLILWYLTVIFEYLQMEVEDEAAAIARVKQMESEEPLLQENPRRFVLFPITHPDIWQFYKKAEGAYKFLGYPDEVHVYSCPSILFGWLRLKNNFEFNYCGCGQLTGYPFWRLFFKTVFSTAFHSLLWFGLQRSTPHPLQC